MQLKYAHGRENQPGVSMSSCTTWEKLIKSVAEQAFCDFILYVPWGTVKYISSTNQNNHLLNSFVRWTQWCTTHQLIMKSAYFDSSNQKRRAFALKPRDFISNHETKPWSRQKCSIATSLSSSFLLPNILNWLDQMPRNARDLQMCKLHNCLCLSLFSLVLLSKKKVVQEPKTQGYMKRFESESRVSLGNGSP